MSDRSVEAPTEPPAERVDSEQPGDEGRARRAPGVVLVGALPGSGFERGQWLVERDGHYVQLTELLYRVLEALEVERPLSEVAEQVSEVAPWRVTEDHVRQLLEQRLAPLGLAEFGVESGAEVAPRVVVGSPLRLHHQLYVLGPRQIEGVARVGQVLFTPVILVPALLAAAVAHAWLYFRHGVGSAFSSLLSAPALLLAVMALTVVGAGVHEFGHASALRYGGQRARAMGAGFYLIYPAFYTDTTDAYRLDRRGRVRTDLGGFYFHLLFSLGVVLAYGLTGAEWLLLVVVLIDLDIARQLLPLVRLDGYWALSDLTGIPDLLSLTGSYLKSWRERLAGRSGSSANPTAGLRRGPARVFVAYVLVTVPALAVLLVVFLLRVPSIMTLGWQALSRQTDAVSLAYVRHDVWGVALGTVQAMLVVLPATGTALFLVILTKTAYRLVRNRRSVSTA